MAPYNPSRYLWVLHHVELVKITWFLGEINAFLLCVVSCYYSSEKIKKTKKFPYVDNRNMEGNDKYEKYTVKHNSINDFIKVYFLHYFVQRNVSALVMIHLQVDYFS
jgi:hypothetical protein